MADQKHQEYDSAIDEYSSRKIEYVFIDIHEELDNIERYLDTESSKMLLHWIRDAIMRVSDNYNDK